MTAFRLALGDAVADRTRSLMVIAAIAPIVAAYLILSAVADGLVGDALDIEEQNIVLLSPNALDPASGRLDPSVLDTARLLGGDAVENVEPMIFRPIRMDDQIVQLRAAPFDGWTSIHGLSLLEGHWPDDGDTVAITEGVAVATGWGVGTEAEIFGTSFEVSALVRAPGTKFASVWMRFERAEQLFEGQSGFQMVTITPARGVDVRALEARLAEGAGSDYSVYFTSELASQATAREDAASNLSRVSTLIGVAALAFGTFNLAALTIVERRRDIGIARALGISAGSVSLSVTIRSAFLATIGFLTGGAIALVVLASAPVGTLRGFVFEASLPPLAWALGFVLTLAMAVLGTWTALRSALASEPVALLEQR